MSNNVVVEQEISDRVSLLVKHAKKASAAVFIRAITKTIDLLSNEQKASGSNIVGKLVKLPASGEVIVVGDIHGDIESLSRIIVKTEFVKKAEDKKDVKLLFMGDYGDRGKYSPEVFYLLLSLKNRWHDNVILMRGNHESTKNPLPSPNDLPTQLAEKYSALNAKIIYEKLQELFGFFYTCVIIEGFAVFFHAGPPSEIKSVEDIAYADQNSANGVLEEMLWSDPREGIKGTLPSSRGAGKFFGSDVTYRLLRLLGVKIVIRGHESCMYGYKVNHDEKVLTLFSTNKAPYFNKYACYLDLDFSKETDAQQIEDYIMKI